MTDATILVPTHAHAAFLPFSLRSALAQEGVSVELFVVGDGVEDGTRRALEPFLADPRVRFFDNPKGRRHGERHRHQALQEASGEIVCYLCDDDLLLPDHVATMKELLAKADFAHGAPLYVATDGSLVYLPLDLSRPRFVEHLNAKRASFGLTGAAHTLEVYRRLPEGWRPAPPDIWTDLHMWQQFLALPGLRGVTGTRLTCLHFPSPHRSGWPDVQRASELERWTARLAEPRFRSELDELVADAIRRSAIEHRLWALDLEERVEALEGGPAEDALAALLATRTFRLRERLLRNGLLRRLLARSPAAR